MSASDIKCCICLSVFQINDTLKIGKCDHFSCSKCLVKFVTNNLQARIKCPVGACPVSIQDPIIRKCLSNDQTTKYQLLSISGPNFKADRCLVQECPYVYYREGDQGIFICEFCESPNCLKCKDIHYPNDCGKNEVNKIALHKRALEVITKRRRAEVIANEARFDLLPNNNSFECSFCAEFVLPNNGVVLRNCLCNFCRTCLEQTYANKNHCYQFKCQTCNVRLADKELSTLIEEKRFVSTMITEATFLMYHCKKDDCEGLYDLMEGTTSYECPQCKSINCTLCNDIHTGLTCEQFRITPKYITMVNAMKNLSAEARVNCQYCRFMLIQNGGCGALHCDNCGNHTCVFTGLFAGRHDPKLCGCWAMASCNRKYCECTPKEPCHPKCTYGCFPE